LGQLILILQSKGVSDHPLIRTSLGVIESASLVFL
jgi:hypothetical protein